MNSPWIFVPSPFLSHRLPLGDHDFQGLFDAHMFHWFFMGNWKMGCYINKYILYIIYPYLICIYIYIHLLPALLLCCFFTRSVSRWSLRQVLSPDTRDRIVCMPGWDRLHDLCLVRPGGAPCCATNWGLCNCLRWVDGSQKRVIFSIQYLWNMEIYYWLVVWNIFYFFHILGIIIPTDFHIFQRGRYTTNQKYIILKYHSMNM